MSTVFVVNIEKSDITETIGVYKTEKEAKKAAKDHTKDTSFKPNKQEDSNENRIVLFKDKDNSSFITLNKVESVFFKKKSKTKKELSPFMLYSKENRKRIVEENPKATFGEIACILGKEWKEFKAEQQKD